MSKTINIKPFKQELPSDFADRLGIYYTQQVSTTHKKVNGQFFTPTPIALLLASFCDLSKTKIRILDPGCGTAILSCTLVEHLVKSQNRIEQIDLVAYETDFELIPYSQKALEYLKEWLLDKGIQFNYILHYSDFVL
jgi:adenine-specific DNA-methyltransferase